MGEPHLIYDINKCLNVMPAELINGFDLILAGKGFLDQRDDFSLGEIPADQAFVC